MTTFMTYKEECESLRQQLAEKDAEIERLQKLLGDTTECVAAGITEIDELHNQLAASQAREQRLREALNHHHEIGLGSGRDKSHSLSQLIISGYKHGPLCRITAEALALPQDPTNLEALIAKAGEVMRERCADETSKRHEFGAFDKIRAIPGVTLEDLKS